MKVKNTIYFPLVIFFILFVINCGKQKEEEKPERTSYQEREDDIGESDEGEVSGEIDNSSNDHQTQVDVVVLCDWSEDGSGGVMIKFNFDEQMIYYFNRSPYYYYVEIYNLDVSPEVEIDWNILLEEGTFGDTDVESASFKKGGRVSITIWKIKFNWWDDWEYLEICDQVEHVLGKNDIE